MGKRRLDRATLGRTDSEFSRAVSHQTGQEKKKALLSFYPLFSRETNLIYLFIPHLILPNKLVCTAHIVPNSAVFLGIYPFLLYIVR